MLLPSLKFPPKLEGTGFNKQEILSLVKAYIYASSDPFTRKSQSEEMFHGKVCDNYNHLVESEN